MKKTLQKPRPNFGECLIQYAIKGGVLKWCENHLRSVYRPQQDFASAHAIVQATWQKGYISSDPQPAIEQMDQLINKAPNCCSHVES